MKFEYRHTIGSDHVTVIFSGQFLRFKPVVTQALVSKFEKFGGEFETDNYSVCVFPSHITVEMIKKVIHNTCFVCGGLMKNGQTIQNNKIIVDSYDSAMDTYEGQIEYPDTNNHSIIKVRKCTNCGHSHT